MTKMHEIETLSAEIVALLRLSERNDWASALESLFAEFGSDPDVVARKILSMYGGMGSLNDLVLYKGGQPLLKENDELDALRLKLHALCLDVA